MLTLIQELNQEARLDGLLRVEVLTEGVVSAQWSAEPSAPTGLVYLHVGDGTKPPVELGFDGHKGRLASAQVVLQDEAVNEEHVFGTRLQVVEGLPVADITPWRGEEQILDHPFRPLVAWEPAGTLTVRIARTESQPTRECSIDGLSLVLDERDLVLGFRLRGLDNSEIAAVEQATAGRHARAEGFARGQLPGGPAR